MAEPLNPIIKAYRAGETLPKQFSRAAIIEMLNGINAGLANGMPEIGAKNYGDKVLLEGREDAGTNGYNSNNPRAAKLANTVAEQARTFDSPASAYPAAVLDKMEVAKRLNIPFELAWNGTGRTKGGEADGQRHSARADKMVGAIDDPKNVELKDLIDRGIKGDLTPTEQATQVSYNVIRANAAGLQQSDYISRDGQYTREAKDGINATVDSVIKDKNLSVPRAAAVRKDLTSPADTLNLLPKLWRTAAGLITDRTPELNNMSPDTIDVLNAIIGNK